MKKITIGIMDDHKLIREMWVKMFAGNSEYEVTGESGTLENGIEMVRSKRPDILLLDINLSNASGMDAVPEVRKISPGTKIIAVSMHDKPAYAKKMLKLGAKAYVTKNSSHEEIFKAIEEVLNGRVYVCAEIKDRLSDQLLQGDEDEPNLKDLSFREIEVIKLIKEGLFSKEMSLRLKISVRTVEVHRHNILKKLKLKNTASLINFISTTDLAF